MAAYKKPKVRNHQQKGDLRDVPGQMCKQNIWRIKIRMRLGFLTHIMFLNYCTLQIPNSWILSSWEGFFVLSCCCFFQIALTVDYNIVESSGPPVLFPSAIKWSLTACLLNADYCISLTATILGLNWKWPRWALYCFHTFFPPPPPSFLPNTVLQRIRLERLPLHLCGGFEDTLH